MKYNIISFHLLHMLTPHIVCIYLIRTLQLYKDVATFILLFKQKLVLHGKQLVSKECLKVEIKHTKKENIFN